MQAESSKPSMPISTDMSAVEGESQVRVKSNRCPYCHDDVEASGSVVCQDCLTRHHPECWNEGLHCSSCSSPNKLVSSSEPQKIEVEAKTDQSAHWDDFGRPDLAVQEARRIQQDHGTDSRHTSGDAFNGSVPSELQCTKEDCQRMGAMYSAYSEDRLCPGHAQTHDRRIRVTRALVFFAVILLGIGVSVSFVPWVRIIIFGLYLIFAGLLSRSRSS